MISLKNTNVAEFVEMKLDKIENSFSERELNEIMELVYDTYTINEEVLEDDLADLKYFKGLKKLYLMNVDISKESAKNIFILPSLEEISFEKVNFLYTDFIANLNVKEISFVNTNIEDYSFFKTMTGLEKVELIGVKEVNLDYFDQYRNLSELDLGYSNILNVDKIKYFYYLNGLAVNDTNIRDLKFLEEFQHLKYVGLDKTQIEENAEIIKMLREKEVEIFIDNMIEY